MVSGRIIYGINTVRGALARNREQVVRVYLQDNLAPARLGRLQQELERKPVPVIEKVSAARLQALAGIAKHQGVVAELAAGSELDERSALALLAGIENPLVLVLDGIEDPRNFGACLRSAEGAGADLVVIGRSRGVALTPVVSKVASGAAETQAVARVANIARFLRELQQLQLRIVGTDAAGPESLFATDLSGPVALVLGAEGQGLRQLTRSHCDALVHLPMHGSVESLNIAVAAGICLYEAVRQRN